MIAVAVSSILVKGRHFHDLRRSTAALLLEQGGELVLITDVAVDYCHHLMLKAHQASPGGPSDLHF